MFLCLLYFYKLAAGTGGSSGFWFELGTNILQGGLVYFGQEANEVLRAFFWPC